MSEQRSWKDILRVRDFTLRYSNTSSLLKCFPDTVLRFETGLCPHPDTNKMALHQSGHPARIRLCLGADIRYSTTVILALLQFLRW